MKQIKKGIKKILYIIIENNFRSAAQSADKLLAILPEYDRKIEPHPPI
jgi:hypothetical protein